MTAPEPGAKHDRQDGLPEAEAEDGHRRCTPTKTVANSRFGDVQVQKSCMGRPCRSASGMNSAPPGSTADDPGAVLALPDDDACLPSLVHGWLTLCHHRRAPSAAACLLHENHPVAALHECRGCARIRWWAPVRLRGVTGQRASAPVVGMVGGGQLARMTHQAAVSLGVRLRVLAASPDDSAAQVAPTSRSATTHSLADLRAFAVGLRRGHLRPRARARRAPGRARAGGRARSARVPARCATRRTSWPCASGLPRSGVPCPRYRPVRTRGRGAGVRGRCRLAGGAQGDRGGYDGRGVWVCRLAGRSRAGARRTTSALIAEEHVRFRRELAAAGRALAARAGRRLPGGADRAAGRHLP